jgi:hypothetical protein
MDPCFRRGQDARRRKHRCLRPWAAWHGAAWSPCFRRGRDSRRREHGFTRPWQAWHGAVRSRASAMGKTCDAGSYAGYDRGEHRIPLCGVVLPPWARPATPEAPLHTTVASIASRCSESCSRRGQDARRRKLVRMRSDDELYLLRSGSSCLTRAAPPPPNAQPHSQGRPVRGYPRGIQCPGGRVEGVLSGDREVTGPARWVSMGLGNVLQSGSIDLRIPVRQDLDGADCVRAPEPPGR